MPIRAHYAAGTACWFAYAAVDPRAAGDFYQRLFGWRLRADPGMPGVVRAMTDSGGVVASLTPSPAARAGWTVCVSAPDLAAAIARLADSGAHALTAPIPMGSVGSLALAEDRCGNVFGLFSGNADVGVVAVDEPGAVVAVQLRHECADALLAGCMHACGVMDQTVTTEDRFEAEKPMRVTTIIDHRGHTGFVPVLGSEDLEMTMRQATAMGAEVELEGNVALMRDPAGAVVGLAACDR